MDSVVLYTEEIDDLQEAAKELFDQAKAFPLKKNSVALLYAEEETDLKALYALLSKQWDFPIVGCTAMAMLMSGTGYRSIGISVMLITGDDVSFAAGISGTLNRENCESEMARAYAAVKAQLPSEEKLILTFGGMPTEEDHIPGDEAISAIEKACGKHIPIFGGLASDGFTCTNACVFCNGETGAHRQVLLLIAGNVNPQVVEINSIENRANFTYKVTESKRNKVFRLGEGTFWEALKRENIVVKTGTLINDHLLSPFIVAYSCENGDAVEVARTLIAVNPETGAGTFIGSVPEGSILSVGIINRSDVQKSVEQACDKMAEAISSAPGRYTTLLCMSCCARFLAMASNTNAEMDACRGRLPGSLSILGMYGNGEFCPTRGSKTGEYHNLFHNFTFAMVAL
jgi:hypothetical protein